MKLFLSLCCVLLFAVEESLTQKQNGNNAENSYSYAYTAKVGSPVPDGLIEAKEWRSGNLVTGSYSLLDSDGRARLVIYRADKSGYSATVETNEVAYSENPANVVYINDGTPVLGSGTTPSVSNSSPLSSSSTSSSSSSSSSSTSSSSSSSSPPISSSSESASTESYA